MEIILKYYDKLGRLRKINGRNINTSSIIRFKILREKEFPCCDFGGKCTNFAYAEVFPGMMKNSKKKGWNYLCKGHYYQEEKRLKWKLPACLSVDF